MSDPLVSTVIPLFDGERFLAAALESVLAQTWPEQEVIVVDDGSGDDSPEIASGYPVRLVRQEHAGVASARNRGLEEARGPLIAFLDQDDLWLPEKLALQVERLRAEPDAQICACATEVFLQPGCDPPAWMDRDWLEGAHHTTHLGSLLVRREVFELTGPFDTSYSGLSDTDWFLRGRDLGIVTTLLDVPCHRYRIHDSNASSRGGMRHETVRAFADAIKRKREKPGA